MVKANLPTGYFLILVGIAVGYRPSKQAPHPSPLSAYRGFFGCRHFSQTNEFLRANGLTPIDWQIENIPAAGNRTDAVF